MENSSQEKTWIFGAWEKLWQFGKRYFKFQMWSLFNKHQLKSHKKTLNKKPKNPTQTKRQNKTVQSKGCISRPAIADTSSRLCLCFLKAFPTCFLQKLLQWALASPKESLWIKIRLRCLYILPPWLQNHLPPLNGVSWNVGGPTCGWVLGLMLPFFWERFTGKPVSPLSVSVNCRNPDFLLPQVSE